MSLRHVKGKMIPSEGEKMLSHNEIKPVITRISREISEKVEKIGKNMILCSILKGAVYFTVDLSRELNIPHTIYFVEASSYEGQKQSDKVEILTRINQTKFHGKHIVLVDELYDNGKTIHTIKNHILSQLDITKDDITTCVLFRKKKETEYELPDIVGFDDMMDVWYVGYGLDSDGKYRNLTDLYAVPKSSGIEKSPDDEILFGS